MRKRFTRTARSAPRSTTRLAFYSVVGGCALAWSNLACALGLGDITLHSSLNQPLNADIALTDSAGLDENDIRVSLGTPEEFARAGLDRSFFLTDLRFTPMFRNGRKVIHVSSSKVVAEPYLNFIVQVTPPSGQLLRTYTLLIDPPGSVALAPPLVATNAPAEAVSSVAPMPTPVQPPSPPPAAQRKKTSQDSNATKQASASEQLTATAEQNQQLQQSLDNLQARMQELEDERASKDEQLAQLQSRLAEAQALAAARNALAPAPATPAPGSASGAAASGAAAVVTPPVPAPATATATANPGQTTTLPSASSTSTPAPAPTVARPTVNPPAPATALPVAPETDDLTWLLQLGALVALLLLVGAWLLQRRRQRPASSEAATLPAVVSATSQAESLAAQAEPDSATPAAARREQAPATDALDAASIYIAYGRFNEALGVLREGLQRQPERRDLRLRILEVLGLQGNAHAYAEEEAALRANGEQDAVLDQTRSRFPKLAPAAVALAAGAAMAADLAPRLSDTPPAEPFDERSSFASPGLEDDGQASGSAASDLDIDFDALGDLGDPADIAPLASGGRESEADEFHLNLDDVSLDADWSSMDPFEPPPALAGRPAHVEEIEPEDNLAAADSLFFSNLRELPEVLELPEEEFLSDFADEPLAPLEEAGDDLDAAFLDSFADEPTGTPGIGELELQGIGQHESAGDGFEPPADALPDLDDLSIDFDDIQSQAQSADRLDQARSLLARGEQQEASWLLHELLQDGDEPTREAARQLLSGL
ncbi:hypothetical protein [Pseudomonas sp. RIT-PI-S]|uniref:FimV/HubP-related protein n=1 Tax=Pseudomonas sp. RIT-PI-S TaxID=3035295 RepID=UPI0021D8FCEF|nr:hypothetical protein [Pseudomonas sp. RIT-PI-S]